MRRDEFRDSYLVIFLIYIGKRRRNQHRLVRATGDQKDYKIAFDYFLNETSGPDQVFPLIYFSAPDPNAKNAYVNLTKVA